MTDPDVDHDLDAPIYGFTWTQYLRPDGHKREEFYQCSQEVANRAQEIIDAGYRFECEIFSTGLVSFTITNEDGDAAIRVGDNGPGVRDTIENLVMCFEICGG